MTPSDWTDLLEAAAVLRDAAQRLRDTLGPDAPARFRTAIGQMAQRAVQFAEQAVAPDLRDRQVRHDLRAHLALVIGYAELWLKNRKDAVITGYLGDLEKLIGSARRALDLLDKLVADVTGAEAAVPKPKTTPFLNLANLQPLSREVGRVLVVDDNRENRDLLQAILEQQGHSVVVAASGREALEILARQEFDLILLDVIMPEMDGYDVLRRVKADVGLRHIPVLMVSALDRLESAVEGIAYGAEDYLTRPIIELQLRARIGACLEKKRLRDNERRHLTQIDRLLHAIFPPVLVEELTHKGSIQPRLHDKVGVCFVDVVGFTSFCDQHASRPEEIVRLLEWYIMAFEEVAVAHGVQKIKTIGDAFLMVSGLLVPVDNPVLQLVRCAAGLLEKIRGGPAGWQVRIGVHAGPVVAGTLGESQYSFDLWGSTVNIAARMQTNGRPGAITMSEVAWNDIRGICRGVQHDVAVRGIGPMSAWEFAGFLDDTTGTAAVHGTTGADGSGLRG